MKHISSECARPPKPRQSNRVNLSEMMDRIKARICRLNHIFNVEDRLLNLGLNVFGEDLAGSGLIAIADGEVEYAAGADDVAVIDDGQRIVDCVDRLVEGGHGWFALRVRGTTGQEFGGMKR